MPPTFGVVTPWAPATAAQSRVAAAATTVANTIPLKLFMLAWFEFNFFMPL